MVRRWLDMVCCTAVAVVVVSGCAAGDDGAQQVQPGSSAQAPPTTDAEPSPQSTQPQQTADPGLEPTLGAGPTEQPVSGGQGRPATLGDLLDEQELTAFSEGCETAAREYVQGDVAYPRSLPAQMGEAASYDAAVAIRQVTPSSATDLIDAADPTEEPVKVQCLVAARLVAVTDSIEVEEPDEAGDGGWVYQEFTPDGTLEWAWSVTPNTPRTGTVRLEMRPAVKGFEVTEVTRGKTARFSSDVVVDASWLQRGAHWARNDGQDLTVVAGFLGAGLLGLLAFVPKVRDGVSGALRPGSGAAPQGVASTSTGPPVSTPAAPRRGPAGAKGPQKAASPGRTRKRRPSKR